MELADVVELQADIFRRVFDFQPYHSGAAASQSQAVSPSPSHLAAPPDRRDRAERYRALATGIALGVGRTEFGRYKLTVLVQDRRLRTDSVLDEIRNLSPDEVDFAYVGRVETASWHRTLLDPVYLGCSVGIMP